MDPITSSVIAGAAGGAAGKALEIVIDVANKTLFRRFQDQREATQLQAKANTVAVLEQIEQGFARLEASNAITQERIDEALRQPAVAALTTSALYNGMKTSNHDKHVLLARLVIERLSASEETRLSMASELACQAVASATPVQLRILGLRSTLDRLNPGSVCFIGYPEESQQTPLEWIITLLEPYRPLDFRLLDFQHLQAISCTSGRSGTLVGELITSVTAQGRYQFTAQEFQSTSIGVYIAHVWDAGLVTAELTSVGLLVGIYVSDSIRGAVTDLSEWK